MGEGSNPVTSTSETRPTSTTVIPQNETDTDGAQTQDTTAIVQYGASTQGDSSSVVSVTQPAAVVSSQTAVVRTNPSNALVHNPNGSGGGVGFGPSSAAAAAAGGGMGVGAGGMNGGEAGSMNVVPMSSQKYIDITDLLTLPQSEAASILGVPTSTLSKRWKEAVRGRKWPFRTVTRIDKEILTLLHNIPQGSTSQQLPEEVEASLALLMKRRQEELKPVIIRL